MPNTRTLEPDRTGAFVIESTSHWDGRVVIERLFHTTFHELPYTCFASRFSTHPFVVLRITHITPQPELPVSVTCRQFDSVVCSVFVGHQRSARPPGLAQRVPFQRA